MLMSALHNADHPHVVQHRLSLFHAASVRRCVSVQVNGRCSRKTYRLVEI